MVWQLYEFNFIFWNIFAIIGMVKTLLKPRVSDETPLSFSLITTNVELQESVISNPLKVLTNLS